MIVWPNILRHIPTVPTECSRPRLVDQRLSENPDQFLSPTRPRPDQSPVGRRTGCCIAFNNRSRIIFIIIRSTAPVQCSGVHSAVAALWRPGSSVQDRFEFLCASLHCLHVCVCCARDTPSFLAVAHEETMLTGEIRLCLFSVFSFYYIWHVLVCIRSRYRFGCVCVRSFVCFVAILPFVRWVPNLNECVCSVWIDLNCGVYLKYQVLQRIAICM